MFFFLGDLLRLSGERDFFLMGDLLVFFRVGDYLLIGLVFFDFLRLLRILFRGRVFKGIKYKLIKN